MTVCETMKLACDVSRHEDEMNCAIDECLLRGPSSVTEPCLCVQKESQFEPRLLNRAWQWGCTRWSRPCRGSVHRTCGLAQTWWTGRSRCGPVRTGGTGNTKFSTKVRKAFEKDKTSSTRFKLFQNNPPSHMTNPTRNCETRTRSLFCFNCPEPRDIEDRLRNTVRVRNTHASQQRFSCIL